MSNGGGRAAAAAFSCEAENPVTLPLNVKNKINSRDLTGSRECSLWLDRRRLPMVDEHQLISIGHQKRKERECDRLSFISNLNDENLHSVAPSSVFLSTLHRPCEPSDEQYLSPPFFSRRRDDPTKENARRVVGLAIVPYPFDKTIKQSIIKQAILFLASYSYLPF